MNQRINKVTEEINKIEAQIAKLQERLPALKKKRDGMENAEIIRMVRSTNVSPDELAAFIASIKGNIFVHDKGEEKDPADEAGNEGVGANNEG